MLLYIIMPNWRRGVQGPQRYRYRGGRRGAARRIQRAFRRRRARKGAKQKYSSQMNRSTTKLGKYVPKMTLSKRVKALEVGSSKHHDTASLTGELIVWNGTDLNPAKNSYSGLLAVQGPLNTGAAGDPILQENEQRMNDVIFCKSVRIRGELRGIRVQDLAQPMDNSLNLLGQLYMENLCKTRVAITLLQDLRPSVVNTGGNSDINPLPLPVSAGGEGTAIASIYEAAPLNAGLQFFGVTNANRSYDSSRFRIVHQEILTTNMANSSKFFDISVKINRKLKYVPPRPPPSTTNPEKVPYNYNLLVFFTMVSHPVPLAWSGLVSPASITTKSSRMYFVDA